jgi:DNA-binding GntR family transcriptional regulator
MTMDDFDSLSEYTVEKIRENIQMGKYPPGSKLRTADLARELGVSRTPVIAAINRLIVEGLVEPIPNRGTFVKRFTTKHIFDVLKVRYMIEVYSAPLSAANASKHPEILVQMESMLDSFEKITDEDYLEASRLESTFHNLFVSLSENDQLLKLFQLNWSVGMIYYLYASTRMPMTKQKESLSEHRQILSLLKEGKQLQLTKLIEKHMLSGIKVLEYELENGHIEAFLR